MTETVTEGRGRHAAPDGERDLAGAEHLLELDTLEVEFRTRDGVAKVLSGVNLYVDPGETVVVLGESGSGKSVTAQTIMGILDTPPGFVTGGKILFKGRDLLKLSDEERRKVRGTGIAMVFQDALSALNPVFTVGFQISEVFRKRQGLSRKDAQKRAIELLDLVRIPHASERIRSYPHEFSGGMRQRVMIAMSIALDPDLLIADEPTTALDVTVQAQIMDLLAELQRERQMALMLITHDLGVVADVADRIAVMYAGKIVEEADVFSLYARPGHPYTRGLLESIPRLDLKGQELSTIKGLPPSLLEIPSGCAFHPRCPMATELCRTTAPPMLHIGDRYSRCHYATELLEEDA
jgi:oligopeptide/dipeptide ABC transporter ATP-binding protein